METLMQLFGSMMTFVYHCFDRIVKKSRSRFTHYYFYLRDEKLGAMCVRVASFLPFQTTCYLNCHNYIERELLHCVVSFFIPIFMPLSPMGSLDRTRPFIACPKGT